MGIFKEYTLNKEYWSFRVCELCNCTHCDALRHRVPVKIASLLLTDAGELSRHCFNVTSHLVLLFVGDFKAPEPAHDP